jgi:peptide/nickel transport system ATP-binding protein
MTAPLLAVENLTVALPEGGDRANAIENVSLHLNAGEILCVVGESGSGKSVTANAVMGILAPSLAVRTGSITFEGRNLLALPPPALRALRGARLGMIFQEPMTALNPLMRVHDQIAEVLHIHHSKLDAKARVLDLLEAVRLPDPPAIARAYPHMLSGGQRQRVMIAIALALEPALLIADEPTTALDVTTQMQILRLIADIQQRRGTGILFITHDFGVVAEIADRVAVMQHGRVVEEGHARDVLDAPTHPYTRALIAAIPRRATTARPPSTTRKLLEFAAVEKTYWRGNTQIRAIDGVSLTLRQGETLGLVGESGSGKSTLARCAVNLVRPDTGNIRFDDTDLTRLSRRGWRPFRKRIQFIFQDPFASLDPRRRVDAIIADGPIAQGTPRRVAHDQARELLRLVQLDPSAALRYPYEFSGGQRQRISIARALAMQPDLLIADEPVSALDVSVQEQVLALLEDLRSRLGLTMLFITHDLRVASRLCDRIAVMQRGRVVEEGITAEILDHPQHPYTQELLAAIPGRAWRTLNSNG